MSAGEEGFAQEYDPRARTAQTLHLYCRLCRRIFPVTFKPRRAVRLKCLCGHEAALAEFDVFKSEARARDFAGLYEKIYRAAKDALRAANLPIPPSTRLPQVIRDEKSLPSDVQPIREGDPEDLSDIGSAWAGDGSDLRGEDALAREKELRAAVEEADDVVAKHEALSDLIEHLYCVRHLVPSSRERFVKACREDMAIARAFVDEAKRRKRAGQDVRVAFTSYRHLSLVLEEEEDWQGALAVVEAAQALGLKGYDAHAAELRAKVGPARKSSVASKKALTESSDAVIPSSEELLEDEDS